MATMFIWYKSHVYELRIKNTSEGDLISLSYTEYKIELALDLLPTRLHLLVPAAGTWCFICRSFESRWIPFIIFLGLLCNCFSCFITTKTTFTCITWLRCYVPTWPRDHMATCSHSHVISCSIYRFPVVPYRCTGIDRHIQWLRYKKSASRLVQTWDASISTTTTTRTFTRVR